MFPFKICIAVEVYLQMVFENISKNAITAVGIFDSENDSIGFEIMKNTYNNITGLIVNYEDVQKVKILEMRYYFLTDVDFVLVQNLAADENVRTHVYSKSNRISNRGSFWTTFC